MESFRRLQRWLAPPNFPTEEEKTRQAYLINLIIQAGLILLVFIFVVLPWVATTMNFTRFLVAIISTFICLLLSKLFLNRGWVREAGFLITSVLWLIFVWITLAGPEGLAGTPFLGAITLIPLIAGFVSSTRASVTITGLNWLLGGILVWLELSGQISPGTAYEEPLARYLALMIMFSSFPLLVYLWRRNFNEAIEQVRVVEQAQRETAAYRLQNEALEEAVSIRTSALEESLAREHHLAEKLALALEMETQLGELQSRIITVVSHEFRTPLSVINSSAELLNKFYDKLSPERRSAALVRIHESIFYLNDLLKDVTLVDQAQRARIRPSYQTFAFTIMCQQLSEQLLREVNQPDRLVFQYVREVETPVQIDLMLLQQIVAHLISNALKYSAEDTLVHIHFWLDGAQLAIEVQDEGMGIPLHEQARIFELFYRASNVDEKRGLGLGLFIVQAISRMMQGRVEVESQGEGQGTTLRVYLPILPNLGTKD